MNKANEFIRTAALVVMALAMIFSSFALGNLGAEEQVMGTSHFTSDAEFSGAVSLTAGNLGLTAGNLTVGNGTASVAQNGEDAYVEGQFEVDGEAQFDGAIDANSTSTFVGLITTDAGISVGTDIDVDGIANLDVTSIQGALTLGASGGGFDATLYSATAGDLMLWDASEEQLVITGTAAATALDIRDGNLLIADDLTVNGAATANGDLTVDDTFNVDDTTFSLTGAQTLTPVASMYFITSANPVTITLADGTAGDWLYIYDSANTAVIIADSNIKTSTGGALTLGQYDFLVLWFDGTDWVEVSLLANS